MPALQGLQFVCPVCKVEIGFNGETFRCAGCERRFPVMAGIPDFRVFEDRNLPRQEDLRRVAIIAEAPATNSFEEMLDLYWSFSDITPEHLRKKYIAGAVSALDKGRNLLKVLEQNTGSPLSGKRLLEVGSGTGGTILAAAELGAKPVGIDIAMRWLQVTRKRFMEAGLPCPALVCCCAEYLPFASDSFDAVVSSETLEFALEKDRMIAEIARVMADDGSALVRTANRLTVSKDPFVHLYGIGFRKRVPNHFMLLELRALVVNDEEKALKKCQVSDLEASESEPLMRYRKTDCCRQNRGAWTFSG
jgi:ubiquinone/menaquinone biosynthesis C-methylase UbiE